MNFAVIGLNHGHIYGQVEGLLRLPGARCLGFHAAEKDLAEAFTRRFPQVPWREKLDLLNDPAVDLIASASINADRGPLGVEVLDHGKHFFVDKPPLTTLADVEAIARALERTGKLLFVFYGERMANPLDIKAKKIVDAGEIGTPVHLMGLGPHTLRPETRPAWMWDPQRYGGILNDIASHQVEWFCWMSGRRIKAFSSRVGHFGAVDDPRFMDFGDATLTADNGVTGYIRVDWLTPRKSPIWGDVRGMIVGTKGTLEIRRTIHLSAKDESDRAPHMILTTDEKAPHRVDASDSPVTWPQDIERSIRDGKNHLVPHDMLLHVMEMSVRIQQDAAQVR